MSKWRPSDKNCLYVIPDIHGSIDLLDQILSRILPLRKSDGGQDRLVFLGDYIDRHQDSHKVLDKLIELKKEYGNQVICLKGNHEELFLRTMNVDLSKNLTLASITTNYKIWINNGGDATLIGYFERAGMEATNPLNFDRHRIIDIVPKEHIKFLQEELVNYWEFDHYLFVHAGCNPTERISSHDPEVLLWDRSLYSFCKRSVNFKEPLEWEKTIVTGHNVSDGKPFIHEKFMMLDCGSPRQLLVVELQSMQAFMASPNQERLVAYELKEAEAKTGSFRRSK